MALQLISGKYDHSVPFWQAPFYPFLLAVFYKILGQSFLAVQLLHIFIGCLNCYLLFLLAEKIFDRRTALLSMMIAAFYFPFIIFDTQALAANIIILLNLLALIYLERFAESGKHFFLVTASFCLGASIISHGLSIFTIPVIAVWILKRMSREISNDFDNHPFRMVILFFVIVSIAPAIVSFRNILLSKEFTFISSNSGINLYVGNHPDFETKFNIRNGVEWRALRLEALSSGASTPAEENRYFLEQTIKNVISHPVAVLFTGLKKIVISFSGDETSRNFPIAPLRKHSKAAGTLLWKWKIFGVPVFAFPTGLVVPLSIMGLLIFSLNMVRSKRVFLNGILPGLVALSHIFGMILFFPCTRYRLPAVCLMIPYASYCILRIYDIALEARCGNILQKKTMGIIYGFIFILLYCFSNVLGPLNAPRDPKMELAEHLLFQGVWNIEAGRESNDKERIENGNRLYERAILIDPGCLQALHNLGYVYLNQKHQPEKAKAFFEKVMGRLPRNSPLIPVYRDFIDKIDLRRD
jgi:4-amino-4-deoxy-L-arabinose transferase-like glycosyltransferase